MSSVRVANACRERQVCDDCSTLIYKCTLEGLQAMARPKTAFGSETGGLHACRKRCLQAAGRLESAKIDDGARARGEQFTSMHRLGLPSVSYSLVWGRFV